MPRPLIKPRKEPTQVRSVATVDAILTATARVLVRDGYDRASTNRIAEAAGVSVGSLYQYFPSKEALVAALVDRHMREMLALVETRIETLHDSPLPVAARTLVRLMLEAHRHDPKLHKVMAEQVPRVGRLNQFYEIERQIGVRLRVYLESRIEDVRPKNLDLAVFLLVNLVEGLTHVTAVEHPDKWDHEELVEEIAQIVLRYVMHDGTESVSRSGRPSQKVPGGSKGARN